MTHSFYVKKQEKYDIKPILYGYESCEKSHYYGPAVRTHWLVHYIEKGCGIFKIRDKVYNVKEGEMFVIPPYIETYYEADSKNPWEYIWIGFSAGKNITDALDDVISCKQAGEIFRKIKKCFDNAVPESAYLTARILDLFVAVSEKEEPYEKDYVQKALDIINSEYMYSISIEEIAKRLNIERTYFSALFKRKTGISPKRCLLEKRMNVATALIEKKNTSISVIANSVGYSDLYTFSKMFKKHFGVSPSDY